MNSPTRPDSIVLVHGLWMTPRSWENWVAYYEAKGCQRRTPGRRTVLRTLRPSSGPLTSGLSLTGEESGRNAGIKDHRCPEGGAGRHVATTQRRCPDWEFGSF